MARPAATWAVSRQRTPVSVAVHRQVGPSRTGVAASSIRCANRAAIVELRRVEIDDPRWRQAQRAIGDSMRMRGSKAYLRLAWRPSPEAAWRPVPIDLAGDWTDPTDAEPRPLLTPEPPAEDTEADA